LARYDRLCLSQKNLQLEALAIAAPADLAAIEGARADWTELRRTGLTTAAERRTDARP
jgi:hypothetical protein